VNSGARPPRVTFRWVDRRPLGMLAQVQEHMRSGEPLRSPATPGGRRGGLFQ